MLNVMFMDVASPKFIDNSLETKVEISLEEKESKAKSGNDLIVNISTFDLNDMYAFAGFYFTIPVVNQLYLNDIFKPPIF